jgi:radical SAM superfamily enzyme YgiQ (UPF0313 family)
VRLFRRAGGFAVVNYVGSLSDVVLVRQHKPFFVQDVVRGLDMFREAGIATFLYLIFGGPGETPKTMEETARMAGDLRPTYTLLDYGYRILPGTELQRIAVSDGVISEDDDCFNAHFYYSPSTPVEMLKQFVKRYQAEHRTDNLRALPWMARLVWDKYRR